MEQETPEVTTTTRVIEDLNSRLLACMFADLLARHGGVMVLSCESIALAGKDYPEVIMSHDNHSGLIQLKLKPRD